MLVPAPEPEPIVLAVRLLTPLDGKKAQAASGKLTQLDPNILDHVESIVNLI